MSIRESTDPQGSRRGGLPGWYERNLRKYKRPILVFTLLLLYILVALLHGLALTPAIALVSSCFDWSSGYGDWVRYFIRGTSIFLGFLVYGLSAILVIPFFNRLVLPFLKPYRGAYYSLDVFAWYLHNILTYSLRYSFLEWITPTPFNLLFYRLMGMKIGERTEINSTNISDPGLITLESGVTIGGSATLIAHYASQSFLIISPVVIRKNATIGLRAMILGGVEIGESAKILPNSVVLPKTIVPAGEIWGGVPAKKVESSKI